MYPYTFNPPWPLKNGMLQTLLSSSSLRVRGPNSMRSDAQKMVIDAGDGVRLLGHMSLPADRTVKGLVILLHGWEGSADSTYILNTGKFLYRHGFGVFRLNFRDHGNSHHLNEGIFYAVLFDEVFAAVRQISDLRTSLSKHIVGFSLGGNFALRIAREVSQRPIENLKTIVAISPVLDPDKVTDRIDRNPFIRNYFIKKWFRSLATKQRIFPQLYNFSDVMRLNSIREITTSLLEHYSPYGSVDEYFKGYTLLGGDLSDISVKTIMLIAEDDPIIPIAEFRRLQLNAAGLLAVQRYGGHNGFISGPKLNSWYEHQLSELFAA